jgi:hypothetical protein
VVAEADHRDLATDRLHYGSTGDWLTHVGVSARAKAGGSCVAPMP